MKIRYTRRAFAEREAIFDYLEQRSEQGARRVIERLHQAISYLAEMPNSGFQTDIADVRVLFVGRYPYKVFYRIEPEAIVILHIHHTARRPGLSE